MTSSAEQKLSLGALIALVVGSMIGSGIFAVPAAFGRATGVLGALIAWGIAGAGMLMLAFVFQTLAQRKPELDTGIYAYAKEGFGDYLALRAVQLYPTEFRCAISLNAPAEPAAWLNEPRITARGFSMVSFDFELRQAFFNRSRMGDIGLTKHAGTTGRPVFIIQDTERTDLRESQGRSLRNALRSAGLEVEYLETTMEFSQREAETRADVFSKIADFLNDHVYDYNVNIGESQEVK